jgi:isopentenyl diphosphate isomerase/L-lactate dehydrogenase-like FMN-dependent dehydrogenase
MSDYKNLQTLIRSLTRSLDATMAMTGHKDIKLADHYSEIGKEINF